MKNFYLKNKKALNILLIAIFCVGFFGFVRYCFAKTPGYSGWSLLRGPFISLLGLIASLIVKVCGWVLTATIGAVIDIAQYNHFINNEQIKDAWIIIRDMCNMFFILILLVIAFATILRVETYNAKKLLPKLIIMAVLINFSRTICGLLIDASQLVMLTFVNAFTDATGNFVSLLKVQDFLSLVEDENSWYKAETVGLDTAVGGLMIAVLFIVISTITLLAVLLVFVVRMVMLWIYVVLSPLAFLLSSFPEGQKYASQWWGEFIRYLINGPILAFFIWLSLITMDKLPVNEFATTFAGASGNLKILTGETFMHFIIAIGMLVGGLMVSQQIGGIGASWGANTVKGLSQKGIGFVKGGVKGGLRLGMKGAWKGTTGLAGLGARKFAGWEHGFEIRPSKIITGIKASMEATKKRDEQDVQIRGSRLLEAGGWRSIFGGAGAGKDWANRYVTGFANIRGFKNMASEFRAPKTRAELKQQYQAQSTKLEGINSELFTKYENIQTTQEKTEREQRLQNNMDALYSVEDKYTDPSLSLSNDERKQIEEMMKNLKKEIAKLQADIQIPVSLDKESLIKDKLAVTNEMKRIQEQIISIAPPRSPEARAAYRSMVNEEKTKYKDVKNAAELLQYHRDAVNKGEKYRAAAIAERLFEDSNGNEILNEYGLPSNAIGLHRFIQEQMIGKGIMSEKEGLQLQSDLSETAERVNHWDMAKTVGVDAFGELVSLVKKDKKTGRWDDTAHANAAAAEIFKIDPQGIMRMLNRLAFGGETPNADGTRTFNLSTLGSVLLSCLDTVFEDHGKRLLKNTAMNLAQPHVMEQIRNYTDASEITINTINSRAISKSGEYLSGAGVVEKIKNRGLSLSDKFEDNND